MSDRPWACLAVGAVYVAGNLAISSASRTNPTASPEGLTRHLCNGLTVLVMAWVAGPDTPGWLLGINTCFMGALARTHQARVFSSMVFVSAPLLGCTLGGCSAEQLSMIAALMTCVAILSGGLFEVMHTVWQRAELRQEKLEQTAEELRLAM